MNYEYLMPTKVIFGRNCIAQHSALFKTFGKKALIVTGARSARENGSQKDVTDALKEAGVDYSVFDKVMSNPTIPCVYEGAAAAKEQGADFIIAIGGGSPMDAGKAIALLAAQDIAPEALFSGNYENKVLPMVFVPTTAGTGSEVTQYSILTNDAAQSKTSIASPLIFPTLAFADAKYMECLPVQTTVNTAADALSHLVEGMLSSRASLLSDTLAAKGIGLFTACLPELLNALKTGSPAGVSPEARERLLQASLLGGMVIAQTGTTVVHAMGYSLTYFRDIDHGRANGLLLGAYLEFVEQHDPELARRVLHAAGYPQSRPFREMLALLMGEREAVGAEEIARYAKIAAGSKNMGNCVAKPTEEEILQLYQRSFA
jgi:Alcohol dehydrogenase, class IV